MIEDLDCVQFLPVFVIVLDDHSYLLIRDTINLKDALIGMVNLKVVCSPLCLILKELSVLRTRRLLCVELVRMVAALAHCLFCKFLADSPKVLNSCFEQVEQAVELRFEFFVEFLAGILASCTYVLLPRLHLFSLGSHTLQEFCLHCDCLLIITSELPGLSKRMLR